MAAKTVRVTILREGSMCAIPVPFDPVPVFGRARAPVTVTVNGYTFRSTLAPMGAQVLIPLRKSHREAAGLEGGERVAVTIALDTEERTIEVPSDLAAALQARPAAWERWQGLSFTNRKEHAESVEGAKRAETRARRVDAIVRALAAAPPARARGQGQATRKQPSK